MIILLDINFIFKQVSDYAHTCSIPSNGMNLIIFDLCNVTLFFIVLVAAFNLIWHIRFYGQTPNTKGIGNTDTSKKEHIFVSF